MRELRLRFLGVPRLTLDGVPVHLPRQRSLALLAYLAISGRTHTRDELAALLSGETVGGQERKLLRNALTTLAEQLGDYLIITRQTIAFDTARPHQLDVATLDRLLADDAAPDPAALAWAAERVEDELLAGLTLRDAPFFEAWLLGARAQIRRQLARGVRLLLEHHLRVGEAAAGIALARRLLAIEPWQEDIHRLLMRLLARDGQSAAALAQYDVCRRALADEFGAAPQPETTAFYERLRAGPFAPRHNLPSPPNVLIGREEEVAEVARLLADPACRLVSIVGLGGGGKTRLALAAAARFVAPTLLADDHPFPDGCYLVDLAGIAGSGSGGQTAPAVERRIAMAIGLTLGLAFYGHHDRLEQLLAYLRPKRMLLILDGSERLLIGGRAWEAILREAPGITLLVTTRTRLGDAAEHVRELAGLALPAGEDALEQAPASRLFLREAERLNARIAPEDRPHVARICRLVDGLPLALIAVAGWLRALSCAQIARDLDKGDTLLAGSARRGGDRHESLGAIVAFAWRGLAARDRGALRRLAVFDGHFDRPACEALGVAFPSLLALCERSLVERDGRDGYALQRLIRQYAAAQLARHPAEEARVRARHAAYYAALVARHSAGLYERPEAHAIIGADRANVLAAWGWAVAHLDLGLLAQLRPGLALWHQWAGLHREWAEALLEAGEQLRAALADGADPALRVTLGWLLTDAAGALLWQGDLGRSYQLLAEARESARAVGMIPLEARISFFQGQILHFRGEGQEASALLSQALTLSRAIQDHRLEAMTLLITSYIAVEQGRYAESEAYLRQAEQMHRELGDRLVQSRMSLHRAVLHIYQADFVRAGVQLDQCLSAAGVFGDRPREAWAIANLGVVCDLGRGHHAEADGHFDRALQLSREIGDRHCEAFALRAQGCNALRAGDFARAGACLEQARDLHREVGNPAALSRSLASLGQFARTLGDAVAAEELAQQALRLGVDVGMRHEQALALFVLGQAREGLGDLAGAAAAYRQSLILARDLGLPALSCDAAAGLASVAVAEGAIGEGVAHAAAILAYLETHALAGCEEPGWVALTCYRAFLAARDARTEEALRLGATLLERRVAALPSERRSLYLEAFPARREVLRLWREPQDATADRSVASPIRLLPAPPLPAPRRLRAGAAPDSGDSQTSAP